MKLPKSPERKSQDLTDTPNEESDLPEVTRVGSECQTPVEYQPLGYDVHKEMRDEFLKARRMVVDTLIKKLENLDITEEEEKEIILMIHDLIELEIFF